MARVELVPGEKVLHRAFANAVVRPSEFGLAPFRPGGLLPLPAPDREAIGGRLTVTTGRLVFRAHPVNRILLHLDLLIGTVGDVRRYRSGLSVGFEVDVRNRTQRFVCWSAGKVLAAIAGVRALAAADPGAAARLEDELLAHLGARRDDPADG